MCCGVVRNSKPRTSQRGRVPFFDEWPPKLSGWAENRRRSVRHVVGTQGARLRALLFGRYFNASEGGLRQGSHPLGVYPLDVIFPPGRHSARGAVRV